MRGATRLEPIDFSVLPRFAQEDHLAAFRCFTLSARALATGARGERLAKPPSEDLVAAARAALQAPAENAAAARRFFEAWFRPFRVAPESGGFLTGYYEPFVPASPAKTAHFRWPILGRPADLIAFAPGQAPAELPAGVAGARRLADQSLVPYDDRETIERRRRRPILWVEDAVEAFLIQVQGSAQVEFPDGRRARLAYDGRNGLPYASIGRILIESGEIPEAEMSLARLKTWLRQAGLREGERGLALMRRNLSFVFFKLIGEFDPALGPIAGAGVPLTPLRSIAVDRTIWSYGLPFWIEADLPWETDSSSPFRRLMIAQDTGSAIVGAARADIFMGGGDAAGNRAGAMRHAGEFAVLLPIGEEP